MKIPETISKKYTANKDNAWRLFLFFSACLIFYLIPLLNANSQDFFFKPDDNFKIITKYNLRIRADSKYLGSVYREERQVFNSVSYLPEGTALSGSFYIMEELKHEGREQARKIDQIEYFDYVLASDGHVRVYDGDIFPVLRSFPVFPQYKPGVPLKEGDSWTAFGELLADPLKKGIYTKIRFICEYRYEGMHTFNGTPAHRIFTRHALRYKAGDDPYGDRELVEVSGSRQGYVFIGPDSNAPFFIQNNINETYKFKNTSLSQTGFAHTWYKEIPPMDRRSVVSSIEEKIRKGGFSEQVKVTEKETGISLEISALNFVADQAKLLPGEDKKIASIAEILKTVPDRSFLVEGHTADVGTAESQMILSVKRAEVIAGLLKESGIDPERIIFTGWGGTRPAAPNDTDEGRARNRRVEITILED